MLFRVDHKMLELKVLTDPTAKMNNSSVWIDGKRRYRVTERFVWFDDLEEAKADLTKAVSTKRRELVSKINQLNASLDSLDTLVTTQMKNTRTAIQQYNDENWG